MIGFGLMGFAIMALVALFVRSSVSEITVASARRAQPRSGGADTLRNVNTVLLVLLSCIAGLAHFRFSRMYRHICASSSTSRPLMQADHERSMGSAFFYR